MDFFFFSRVGASTTYRHATDAPPALGSLLARDYLPNPSVLNSLETTPLTAPVEPPAMSRLGLETQTSSASSTSFICASASRAAAPARPARAARLLARAAFFFRAETRGDSPPSKPSSFSEDPSDPSSPSSEELSELSSASSSCANRPPNVFFRARAAFTASVSSSRSARSAAASSPPGERRVASSRSARASSSCPSACRARPRR